MNLHRAAGVALIVTASAMLAVMIGPASIAPSSLMIAGALLLGSGGQSRTNPSPWTDGQTAPGPNGEIL